jgi:hypothetical protein
MAKTMTFTRMDVALYCRTDRDMTRGRPCIANISKDGSAQRKAVMTRIVPQQELCRNKNCAARKTVPQQELCRNKNCAAIKTVPEQKLCRNKNCAATIIVPPWCVCLPVSWLQLPKWTCARNQATECPASDASPPKEAILR